MNPESQQEGKKNVFKKRFNTKVLTFIQCSFFYLEVPAYAQDDWQLWSENDIAHKLNDQWSIHWKPKFVFEDNISELNYWETVQGFKYKAHPHLDLGLYHLYAEEDNSDGTESHEHRARLEGVLKWNWGAFKWSDRNRYEFRTIDGSSKSRYRNQIKISKKFNIYEREFTGYISNEFFIDFETDEFNQNRGVLGFTKRVGENVTAGLYYMIKSSRSGSDWNETNIIGTTFKYDI